MARKSSDKNVWMKGLAKIVITPVGDDQW